MFGLPISLPNYSTLMRDRGDCRLQSGSTLLERNEQPVSDSTAENNEPGNRERTVAKRRASGRKQEHNNMQNSVYKHVRH